MNGVVIFCKKGKLSPRFLGPHKFLKRVGKVSYELEFLVKLAGVHSILHISLFKNCVVDPASVVPLESLL